MGQKTFTKRGKYYVCKNRYLSLQIDPQEVTCDILEKATGTLWRMAKASDNDLTIEDTYKTRTSVSLASSQDKKVWPARDGLNGLSLRLKDLGIEILFFLEGLL